MAGRNESLWQEGHPAVKYCSNTKAKIAEIILYFVNQLECARQHLLTDMVEKNFWPSSKPCMHGKYDIKPDVE